MIKEKTLRRELAKLEKRMELQVSQGMKTGWPVPCWDRNCVERAMLRRILKLRRKPFCAADVMAGW